MPRGKVEIMAPGKLAAIAAFSTAPARAPSCIGSVASGTKRDSDLAAARSASLNMAHQASPSAAGRSLPNQSGQPPLTCLSMPCWPIHAKRPATSLSPFITGRLGFARRRPAPARRGHRSTRREGNCGASLRIVF